MIWKRMMKKRRMMVTSSVLAPVWMTLQAAIRAAIIAGSTWSALSSIAFVIRIITVVKEWLPFRRVQAWAAQQACCQCLHCHHCEQVWWWWSTWFPCVCEHTHGFTEHTNWTNLQPACGSKKSCSSGRVNLGSLLAFQWKQWEPVFLAGYYFCSKCNRSPKIAFMNFFLLASVILWKPFLPPPFLPNLRSRTHNFLEMMETTKTFYFTKLNFSAHTPYPFYFKNTSCNRCLIRKYNGKP